MKSKFLWALVGALALCVVGFGTITPGQGPSTAWAKLWGYMDNSFEARTNLFKNIAAGNVGKALVITNENGAVDFQTVAGAADPNAITNNETRATSIYGDLTSSNFLASGHVTVVGGFYLPSGSTLTSSNTSFRRRVAIWNDNQQLAPMLSPDISDAELATLDGLTGPILNSLNEKQTQSAVLDNLIGTGVAPGATNSSATVASSAGKATNLTEYGASTVSGSLTVSGKQTNGSDLYIRDQINIIGTNSDAGLVASSYSNTAPSILLQKFRGTEAAPTAVLAGDDLGSIQFLARGPTFLRFPAAFYAEALNDFTGTDASSRLKLTIGNQSSGAGALVASWSSTTHSNNLNSYFKSNLIVGGSITLTDQVYSASWDADLTAPTKNAIYDKIEAISAGGISDGDKGQIVVSGSGSVWTIDASAVDNGKIADDTILPAKMADADWGAFTISGNSAALDNNVVGYASLQDITATHRVLGRNTAGSGDPEEVIASDFLDWLGSTRGSILFKGSTGWTNLAPGTSGYVLTSQGTGVDPVYALPSLSNGDKGDVIISESGQRYRVDQTALGLSLQQSLTNYSGGNVVGTNANRTYLAWSFIASNTAPARRISVKLRKTGAPSFTLDLQLRNDSANTPGSLAIQADDAVGAGSVSTSTLDFMFTFASPVTLVAGTRYWGTLSVGGVMGNSADYVTLAGDNSGSGSVYMGNATPTWTLLDASFDGAMTIYSDAINVTAATPFAADNVLTKTDGTGRIVQPTGITVADDNTALFPASVTFSNKVTFNGDVIAPWRAAVAGTAIYASNGPNQIVQLGSHTNLTFVPLSGSDATNSTSILLEFVQNSTGGFYPTINGSTNFIATNATYKTLVQVRYAHGLTNVAADMRFSHRYPTSGQTLIYDEGCNCYTNGPAGSGSGTVTSVAATVPGGFSISGSPVTTSGTLAITANGTSGGVPYYSGSSTMASSAALAANALVIGGGAGVAPSTTTTAAGILTALGTPSSANLATAVTDETGSGALVFAGGNIAAATATTASPGDNDTSVATTAFVTTAVAGATGGDIVSNVVVSSTANVLLDFAAANVFKVLLLTNATITYTNQSYLNRRGKVFYQQDTNGQRLVEMALAGGLLQTNANLQPTTNANALDLLELESSFFATNVMAFWPQNFQPRIAATNSLAGGSGGGACATEQLAQGTTFSDNVRFSYFTNLSASFTTGGSGYTVCKIQCELGASGTVPSGTLYAAIFTDSAGSPGTQVGTASGTIDRTSIAAGPTFVEFTGVSATLSSATTYWVVLVASARDTDGVNGIYWILDSDGESGNAKGKWTSDGWESLGGSRTTNFKLFSN